MPRLIALTTLLWSLCLLPAPLLADPRMEVTPAGHAFALNPVTQGEQVLIALAWRNDWLQVPWANPAVPNVAQRAFLAMPAAGRDADTVAADLAEARGSIRLAIRPDHVVLQISADQAGLATTIEIATALLSEPQYDPRWVAVRADELAAVMARARSNDRVAMWEVARRTALGDGPLYHMLTLPDDDRTRDVFAEDLAAWHDRVLRRAPVAIVAGGAVDQGTVAAHLDTLLQDLLAPPPVAAETAPYNAAPVRIYLHRPFAETTQMGVVARLTPVDASVADRDALAVALLEQRLAPDLDLRAGLTNYDRGNRLIYAEVEVPDHDLLRAEARFLAGYAGFLAAPGGPAFEAARDVQGQWQAANASDLRAGTLGILEQLLDGRALEAPEVGHAAITDLTETDLTQHLADRWPGTEALAVVAVGPNPGDWPGACVIREVTAADHCP